MREQQERRGIGRETAERANVRHVGDERLHMVFAIEKDLMDGGSLMGDAIHR